MLFEEINVSPWEKLNELSPTERRDAVENYLFLLSLAKKTKDSKWKKDIKQKLKQLTKN